VRFSSSIALAALAAITLTTPALAQADVRAACMSDIQKLCPTEFAARDREKIRVCLRANLAKTAPACQVAVKAQTTASKPQ